MNSLLKKSIALLLVIVLIGAYLVVLGEFSVVKALSDKELNEQTSKTNHSNVEFNSYFYGNLHSQTFGIGSEDAKIYINIKIANAGYLENGTIEFQNANFKLKTDEITDDNIQSIDDNKIVLNKLYNGSDITLELPIEMLTNDNVSEDYFNKDTTTKFTGTYTDGRGRENSIEKEIVNRVSWVGTAEAEVTVESTKFVPYIVDENYGVLVQTKVTSNIKDSTLPIQSTELEITVPTINNTSPTTVTVLATKTEATNGKTDGLDFDENNYFYYTEAGMVIINTSNLTEGTISWKKNVTDEYLVTYLFEGEEVYNYAVENGVYSLVNVNANISVYNNEETTVNATAVATVQYEEKSGEITDFAISAPNDLSKGYIYANYDAEEKVETEYYTTYKATISSTELVDSIVFSQEYDKFVTEENAEGLTTIGETNYAYNKQVEISQAVFNKILGEDGTITIKDGNGTEIGTINQETTVENGKYILDISENDLNKITIETSTPITEGVIEINIAKALKTEIGYSKTQMQDFTKIEMEVKGSTNITSVTKTAQTLLEEPETKVELSVSKTDLTTVLTNENVEIRVVLNTADVYNALFTNPTLKITLPSEIEEVELESANILLVDGLEIEEAILTEENGHKVIEITLAGTQTEYTINAEYKGAIIILNTDLTLETLTPSGQGEITVEYTNENEFATNTEGTIKQEVNFVAPTGVVAANGISNYKEGAEDVLTISAGEQTIEIDTYSEEITATINGTVINNYQNNISNIVVLGRIPAENNTEIDTETELGSNFTIPLSTAVGVSGVDSSEYTIYYSDNGNATNDLQDEENAWSETATTESKSFLIVFNSDYEMESGEKFSFSYNINIPENLTANNDSYSMYKVYYENNSEIGIIAETKQSSIMLLTTGTGPELEVNLSSTVDIVREGQIVKMKVTVNNVGDIDAENVVVTVPLPENATFLYYVTANGFYEEDGDSKTLSIGTILAGESAETYYYIKIDNNISVDVFEDEDFNNVYDHENGENITVSALPKDISNVVYVSANELGTISSNTVTFNVQEGKIRLEMIDNIAESQVLYNGQEIRYIINIYNISGMGDLENTVVTIPLPDGVTYKSATVRDSWSATDETTDGVSYNQSTNTVTVDIGTLSLRKLIELYVVVEDFEGDISIMTTATADGAETHYSNVTEYLAEKVSLEVSELTSSPRYLGEGETVTYSLTITNTGKSTVANIKVTDELPEELVFVNATYTYAGQVNKVTNLTNGIVQLTINQLASGESTEITITARAGLLSDTNDKEIENKVTVSAKSFNEVETNTVTNIIEYDSDLHDQAGSSSSTTNRYKISGTAWLDENLDGKRDSSEQRLANIQVVLLEKDGSSIVTDVDTGEEKITTTSSNGTYQFENLPNGEYLVLFVYDSSVYSLTAYQKSGVDEGFNSDVIEINTTLNGERVIAAITDVITINGENARDIDIGLYTADRFDLRLDKYISKITVTASSSGTKTYEYDNSSIANIQVRERDAGQSSAVIEYKIVVTNEGSVAGYANKLVDYLPDGVTFNSELNTSWYLSDNGNIYNASLANELIEPGETKEVTLIVNVSITENVIFSTLTNTAEIYESYNELALQDADSTAGNKSQTEDDLSIAEIVVYISTGSEILIYTMLVLVIIAIVGVGVYAIKKHVLKKKV